MDQNKVIKFLVLWISNSLLLQILSVLFSKNVVLGNINISGSFSSVIVGLIMSVLVLLANPLASILGFKLKDEKSLLTAYFVVNAVFLWIAKRFADIAGLGISSIFFVLIVAVFASILQFGVNKYGSQLLKKK